MYEIHIMHLSAILLKGSKSICQKAFFFLQKLIENMPSLCLGEVNAETDLN